MPTLLLSPRASMRVLACALLILIGATANTAVGRTLAYFTSSATTGSSSMTTVHLAIATSPTVSGVFDVAANMLPGDFDIKTFDVANNGAPGVAQQDVTISLASTSTGTGNTCSLLDSTDPPACSSAAAPNASASTGAALLLLRCTSDVAGTTPTACSSANVYVTQAYPAAGAGTHVQLPSGLTRAAITGVATGSIYSITIGGTSFTGGPLRIAPAVAMGGPDAVAGADGQTSGLAASHTDHLASVVYLPSQAGDALANQTSSLTFTWTASQRLGTTR